MFDTAIQTFTSPVVLFFVLGLIAAFARSDLAIPEPIAKAMSLSAGTVRNYLSNAAAQTGAASSAQAAVIARERGWF